MPRTKKIDLNRAKKKYLLRILVSIDSVGYDASWILDTSYKKIDYLKLRSYFIKEYMPDILHKDKYDTIEQWKEWNDWIDAPLDNFSTYHYYG